MTLGDPELVIRMVQSGLGVSLVSKWAVFRTLKEGTVKILKMQGKRLCRKIYLVRMDKVPSSMVTNAFLEFVRGYRFFMPF